MANEKHLEALKRGPRAWNEFRLKNHVEVPDFTGVKLAGFDLSEQIPGDLAARKTSDLCSRGSRTFNISDIMHPQYYILPVLDFKDDPNNFADLSSADFSGANLNGAFLGYSKLLGAKFIGTQLLGTNFNKANLSHADFSRAQIIETCFEGVMLEGADFNKATINSVDFLDTDLRFVKGLNTANYKSSSSIDLATIGRSGTLPSDFLKGCGIPDKLIEALVLLLDESDQHYSCFISYSHADREFATLLYKYLQERGIRCWLDQHEMLPGDDIYEQIDRGIRLWDKVLLCCSRSSLSSWWVDNEIDSAFEKERNLMKKREHKTLVLIPLDLDGYMFSDSWSSGKRRQLLSRIAGKFHNWQQRKELDKDEIERVVRALRVGDSARANPPDSKL